MSAVSRNLDPLAASAAAGVVRSKRGFQRQNIHSSPADCTYEPPRFLTRRPETRCSRSTHRNGWTTKNNSIPIDPGAAQFNAILGAQMDRSSSKDKFSRWATWLNIRRSTLTIRQKITSRMIQMPMPPGRVCRDCR